MRSRAEKSEPKQFAGQLTSRENKCEIGIGQATSPADPPTVGQSMLLLREAVERLDKSSFVLAERIEPVLTPLSVDLCGIGADAPPSSCEVAGGIDSLRFDIHAVASRLEVLAARVAL